VKTSNGFVDEFSTELVSTITDALQRQGDSSSLGDCPANDNDNAHHRRSRE
jgi:hypothetical protein